MKYITKPKLYWSDDLEMEVVNTTITVCETEDEPQPTGLLDRHGNELYRVTPKQKMGFVLK